MTKKLKPEEEPWIDPDDAPEWTEEMFRRAELRAGDSVVRPASGTVARVGRPRLANPKRQVTLRLDSVVVESFRSRGKGWQGQINEALRKALGL
jgi:uncharacterized protein (DUF4415 family)